MKGNHHDVVKDDDDDDVMLSCQVYCYKSVP